MTYAELSLDALSELATSLTGQFNRLKSARLKLDLTRGKPASQQLDLADELDGILNGVFLLPDGTDVRNYGGLSGIPEARSLGGAFLGLPADEIMVVGNSSLTLMFQYMNYMLLTYWNPELANLRSTGDTAAKVKFLCPVPGYDRHFTMCERFDIEMIPIEMNRSDPHKIGPDMDQVAELVRADPLIKGIWCVPKYSNPGGETYANKTVQALAALPLQAGQNFRILWDNAYTVHHLTSSPDTLLNLMDAARPAANADKNPDTTASVVMFASTSKITFAGAGISFIGLCKDNLKAFEHYLSASIIGPDKVNQLRHVRFLKDADTIALHMQKHAALIKPKFDATQRVLNDGLKDLGIAHWSKPSGGYFISLDTLPGLASEVISMAADIGVKLTPAGATFPYGKDPLDRNIRIAPTFPDLDDVKKAVEVLVVCLKLATVKKMIAEKGHYPNPQIECFQHFKDM